jgi:hypothetical protein
MSTAPIPIFQIERRRADKEAFFFTVKAQARKA